jgi:hypothetical protein
MIAFYRSAGIAAGKFLGAMAFAKEVAAYIKATTGTEVSVALPIGGNPMRIGWASRYESLGAYEASMGKLMADPKYQEMVARAAEFFLPGSVHDEIWRAI